MCLDLENYHFNEFLGSKSYGKMCSFVSVCCLVQELWYFLLSPLYVFLGGKVQQMVKNKPHGTLVDHGNKKKS